MAEGKKSFVLYTDLLKVVEQLPDELAGKLFKIILQYVNDIEVCVEDLLLKIAFEPIKNQLKRDLKNWEKRAERSRNNGKLGGRPSKKEPKKPTGLNENPEKPKKPDTVNVTVNVTDTVNDILLKKETKEIFNTWLQYRKEIKKPIKSEKTKISLAKKIEKEGFEKSAYVINKSIQNGYQGLFWEQKNIKENENIKQHTIGRQTIETIEANAKGWGSPAEN